MTHSKSRRTMDIRRQNDPGAPDNPNGMRVKWNKPRGRSFPTANTLRANLWWQSTLSQVAYQVHPVCQELGMHLSWRRRWPAGNLYRTWTFFFTKHTGEAHEETDGSITPVANISSRISSSASRAARGGRRGYPCSWLLSQLRVR